jgi:hypothetical protein
MFKEYNSEKDSFEEEALKGNTGSNALSDVYFSPQNIKAVQEAIRYQVYIKSDKKHVIDNQSETDLKIVMRSIYIEYAKNLSYDILGQVRELNSHVLEFCVNRILEEINMYLHYRTDISRNYVPLARSENTSSAGSKTLFMKEF